MFDEYETYRKALSLNPGEEIRLYCNSKDEQTHLMSLFRGVRREEEFRYKNQNESIVLKKEKMEDGRYSVILFKMKEPKIFIKKPGCPEEKFILEESELAKLLALERSR